MAPPFKERQVVLSSVLRLYHALIELFTDD